MKLTRTQAVALRALDACRLEDAILPVSGVLEETLVALVRRGLAVIERPTYDSPRVAALTDAGREWVAAHPVRPPRRPSSVELPGLGAIAAMMLHRRYSRRP